MSRAAAPTAIVLAAGGSTRMERPKALLPLRGRTLLAAHLDALASLPRCVVLGALAERLAEELPPGVRRIDNPRWAETGPVDSLALAIRGLDAARVLVTPVDAPPVGPEDLAALLSASPPAVLAWKGRPGHPVLLGPEQVERLRHGPLPERGLGELLTGATQVAARSADVLANLNTPDQWERWLSGA